MNQTLRTLLTRLIDYAGLFPPAKLGMAEAVAYYARCRGGSEKWMLARFITPVSRLDEFEAELSRQALREGEWALSVLPGPDLAADLAAIASFNHRNAGAVRIDTMEAQGGDVATIRRLDADVPDEIALFIELPAADDPAALVSEVARAGRFAKIRTGGVTPDAFLSPAQIVRFMRRCHESGVGLKATAGLHHPLRCVRPLTYESDAPRGTMNGFVNLFLAAALMKNGTDDGELLDLMYTENASDFRLREDVIAWRDTSLDVAAIAAARRELAISFGSCSFDEPIDDLRALSWLE
jgi:hypothetical protein